MWLIFYEPTLFPVWQAGRLVLFVPCENAQWKDIIVLNVFKLYQKCELPFP